MIRGHLRQNRSSPRIKNAFSLNVLTAFGIRECIVHCVANDIHLDLASLLVHFSYPYFYHASVFDL